MPNAIENQANNSQAMIIFKMSSGSGMRPVSVSSVARVMKEIEAPAISSNSRAVKRSTTRTLR